MFHQPQRPGLSTFTRIFLPFSSLSHVRANERNAALLAEYTPKPGKPFTEATDPVMMIDPPSLTLQIVSCGIVSMGQGLGLASISEARASACVSIYSLMCATLPSRIVMSKTHSSLYGLFVA
jgi:hypothetical protein